MWTASLGVRCCCDDADDEAAEQVDQRDDDGGDGVAPDELGRPVHGPVEVGLVGDLGPALLGLLLVDGARVQVGVDGHLLAGHAVEGESSGHLGHAARTGRDHHELDHDQDQEDDQPDDERAADDEAAERLDDRAGVAVLEHEPGGADVEGQPEHGGHEEERGEGRELERLLHVHAHEHHDHGRRDVQADEYVEDVRRHRHDQHDDDPDHSGRNADQANPIARHHTSTKRGRPVPGRGVSAVQWLLAFLVSPVQYRRRRNGALAGSGQRVGCLPSVVWALSWAAPGAPGVADATRARHRRLVASPSRAAAASRCSGRPGRRAARRRGRRRRSSRGRPGSCGRPNCDRCRHSRRRASDRSGGAGSGPGHHRSPSRSPGNSRPCA